MLSVSEEVAWVVAVVVVVAAVVVAMVVAVVAAVAVAVSFFLRFPFFLSSQVFVYQWGCRPLDPGLFADEIVTQRAARPVHGEKGTAQNDTTY